VVENVQSCLDMFFYSKVIMPLIFYTACFLSMSL
jgi:hypothetical protein